MWSPLKKMLDNNNGIVKEIENLKRYLASHQRLKLIICDDDEIDLRSMKRQLKQYHKDIIFTSQPEEVLKIVRKLYDSAHT